MPALTSRKTIDWRNLQRSPRDAAPAAQLHVSASRRLWSGAPRQQLRSRRTADA